MKRGEVWTLAAGPDYAGKPRPCVILQSDAFAETASMTICAVTSTSEGMPLFRIKIEPNPRNGLERLSYLMADKVTTVPKSKLGRKIGELTAPDLAAVSQAVVVFLGLTEGPVRRQLETE